ncbi:MAG: hypothetical protein VSS75_011300 [Candidatus Parabeggiatoa sp.]|nr:hypothetical protein [Candidatus Parabeggiatoa sp.]
MVIRDAKQSKSTKPRIVETRCLASLPCKIPLYANCRDAMPRVSLR